MSTKNTVAGDFKLNGVDQMIRKLSQYKKEVVNNAPQKAVRAGANVIKKGLKNDTPEDTGVLKRNIGFRVKRYRESSNTTAIIGAKSLKELPRHENPSVYFYVLQWRRGADYLWASMSFDNNSRNAGAAVIKSLRSSIRQIENRLRVR